MPVSNRAVSYAPTVKRLTAGILIGGILSVSLIAGCAGQTSAPASEPTMPSAGSTVPASTATSTETPSPPVPETPSGGSMQELALLENYAATSFFPDTIFVRRGVPVRLYFTRLHSEHVNQFAIEPFFSTSDVVLPGEVATFEFLPDVAGEFKIRNVGHGFEATLVVVENEQEEASMRAEEGIQEFALIYNNGPPRVIPEEITVEKDIPVKVYNLAIDEQHRISVPPFYSPSAANVEPMEITTFEFTPNETGTYEILDEISGFLATLIVR